MMKDSAASASATLSIPLHLPPPCLGTFTTATRKRYCGFALAVLALTMHLMLLVVRVYRWAFGAERFSWWAAERVAASLVAVCIFGFILRRPRFSLQERNLVSVQVCALTESTLNVL